jgi:ParB family chromosome partitioning protein
MADDVKQHVQHLDINLIQPNPHQPRKTIDPEEMTDLVDSIKIHGVLEPIVIAHTPAGYQIIAGERRWRASKIAGLTTIPALVKKTSPRGMLEMSIIENVQRSDLNPLERAHAINRLAEEFQLTPSQIARQIGKSLSYITNSVKLLTLPDALKDGLLSGLITEGHARALLGIADMKKMVDAYKTILKENGSVRRAEELARRAREETGQETVERRPQIVVSKDIDRWEQQLHSALGEKSDVKLRRSFRQTVLTIKLQGSLQETQDSLNKILSITSKKDRDAAREE